MYRFNEKLFHLSLRGMGFYNYENISLSGEKHFLKLLNDYFKKSKRKNLVVLDVGANKGQFMDLILKNFKNFRLELYAFEPHPQSFEKLNEKFRKVKFIEFINKALGKKNSNAKLWDYKGSKGSEHASLDKSIFEAVHGKTVESIDIPVITLDSFVTQKNIKKIDFIKIDVEGSEIDVLKGASETIKSGKIEIIQFEITQLNSVNKILFKDFWDLLHADFKIFRILTKGLIELKHYEISSLEIFGYQNLVAIKRTNNGI